ncbi:SMP-30/Gluconolaconase/LRE domain protein [Beutenbergia cavernae DSM 12333]|uniref:SMP-30/Gluconolaconase/LRE domain protein n=1 Tax=Beutenbergia cavernae (strain ATCC BAA-8 / DSM 12333 / CCUG 43141 / JCM 11478 / NBRC 16432 / NCIMB 13614 / HKI 0122) TaxID=471853 RepID=C5C2I6_BEUC1|nr:SMP-30/gluconolactonase/LRE family protein [Beutenbergia cavernae]ACQ79672.1 SMP-30/Gluconolaconase/LRE domain protein [Beutenbergia cavernae DSM 12333]
MTARVFVDGTLSRPQLDHPEGIAVHPDGSVWCGGEHGQLYRIEPDGSSFTEVASTDGFLLGLAFGPDETLYACDLRHRCVWRYDTATGDLTEVTRGGTGTLETPNAVVVAPDGTLYVSDSGTQGARDGRVFRFGPDGSGGPWFTQPLDFANGVALAADGGALYVAETFRPGITRIPIGDDGEPGAAQSVVELPGVLPDGVTLGPDGRLYVGCYEPSRILRVDPSTGETEVLVDDPTAHLLCHPTNTAFRGGDLFSSNLGRWHVTLVEGVCAAPSGRLSR